MPTGKHTAYHYSPVAEGFTYIGILIAVAIIGTVLAATGIVWHTAQQRERERQLLYIGDQIRQAIGHYYNVGAAAGAAHEYPRQLKDLLRDPRLVGVARYLRKIYYDPMTGSQTWGLIKTTDGRIVGVHSLSHAHPIKQGNFAPANRKFDGKDEYSKWTFIYIPSLNRIKKYRKPTAVPAADTANVTGQP